jgi:hypothetical protein
MPLERPPGRGRPGVGRLRPTADHDDGPPGVRAIAAWAILLVDVDVAYDGPAALKLSRGHPYGLA